MGTAEKKRKSSIFCVRLVPFFAALLKEGCGNCSGRRGVAFWIAGGGTRLFGAVLDTGKTCDNCWTNPISGEEP